MEIIDNFLSDEDADFIEGSLLSNSFPWYYNKELNIDAPFPWKERASLLNTEKTKENYLFQFVHPFYKDYTDCSEYINVIDPLIFKLGPTALVRIKANLNPITPEHYYYDQWHTDICDFKGQTAIYYVNTNNGFTLLEDGTKVNCVKNRLLIFDSTKLHTGISCTDQKYRCIINLNYYD